MSRVLATVNSSRRRSTWCAVSVWPTPSATTPHDANASSIAGPLYSRRNWHEHPTTFCSTAALLRTTPRGPRMNDILEGVRAALAAEGDQLEGWVSPLDDAG